MGRGNRVRRRLDSREAECSGWCRCDQEQRDDMFPNGRCCVLVLTVMTFHHGGGGFLWGKEKKVNRKNMCLSPVSEQVLTPLLATAVVQVTGKCFAVDVSRYRLHWVTASWGWQQPEQRSEGASLRSVGMWDCDGFRRKA